MWAATLLGGVGLLLGAGGRQEPETVDAVVAQLVERHFKSASEESRRSLESRLVTLFQTHGAGRPEKSAEAMKRLPLVFSYARSLGALPETATKGGAEPPKPPEEMLLRAYDLSSKLIVGYFEAAWTRPELSPEDRKAVGAQMDQLAADAAQLLLTKVTGPFAGQAIDKALQGFKLQMKSELEGTFSPSSARPLSPAEYQEILGQIRTNVAAFENPIVADIDPSAVPADRKGAGQRAALQEVQQSIKSAARPMWNTLGRWSPETFAVTRQLEDVRSEMERWRADAYRFRNEDTARYVNPDIHPNPSPSRKVVRSAGAGHRSDAGKEPVLGEASPARDAFQDGGRFPRYLVAAGVLICGFAILGMARILRARS